jgi:tetratricopeptide (TPR) repeat protein
MKFMIPILTALFALGFAGSCYADSCTSVKREMTYGRVALQDAKEKQDFLESAKQFQTAVDKAPNCAAAHFNLGIVYEKAEEYQKALKALQQYLTLAPRASDADKVQEKIYELEYRVQKSQQPKRLRNPWAKLNGKWREQDYIPFGCQGEKCGYLATLKVANDTFSLRWHQDGTGSCFSGTISESGRVKGTWHLPGGAKCSRRAGKALGPFTGQVLDNGAAINIRTSQQPDGNAPMLIFPKFKRVDK